MKNALLMGLSAALLFAISASLSLWLNPQRPGEEAAPPKGTSRKGAASETGDERTATPRPVVSATPTGDVGAAAELAGQLKDDLARVARREEEFDRQQDMYRFVLEDIRNEMESLQSLWLRAAEPRAPAKSLAPPPFTPTKDEPSKRPADPIDTKALGKVTGISESMAPENAARIVEQMARGGKMDTAVQLLAKMNSRQAARILAAIPDEKLSTQMVEKLLELRRPAGGPP